MKTSAILLLYLGWLPSVGAQDLASVRSLLDARRPRSALLVLERLPAEMARTQEAVRLRIEASRAAGRFEAAVTHAASYVDQAPSDHEAQRWFAADMRALAREEGQTTKGTAWLEQALEVARELWRKAPEDLLALEEAIAVLHELRRKDEVVSVARAALDAKPGDPKRHIVLARVHDRWGQTGEATAVLNAASAKFPEDPSLPCARSYIHAGAGQRQEAVRATLQALKMPALDDETARLCGEQVWLLLARHREWKEATELVDAWISTHPKNARAWWWRGYLLELQGDLDKAQPCFKKAWDFSDQKLGEAALHLALLIGGRGDLKTALPLGGASLRLGARARPGTRDMGETLIALAELSVQKGDWKEAAEILERHAVPHDGDNWKLQQNLGFTLREWGSVESGRKKKTLAQELWKRSAEHYVVAAELVEEEDIPDTTKAQVLNDTGLMFHYHLEATDRAIRYYEEALRYDSDYLDALENMGRVLVEKKQYADAVTWFDRVLARDPKRAVSKQQREAAVAALREKTSGG